MSEYYSIANITNKNIYYLGTKHAAKDTLPLFVRNFDEKDTIILYGDETHSRIHDKYLFEDSFKEIDYSTYSVKCVDLIKAIGMSRDEFTNKFNEIGGVVIRIKDLK